MLDNIPIPKVIEADSDAQIRAIDVTGATAYWIVRVTSEPASVWRWQPESTLADSSANGVLKPTAISAANPGRWIFDHWDGAFPVSQPFPVSPYRLWTSGNLNRNDNVGIAAYDGVAAGTYTVTSGTLLRHGSVQYVLRLGGAGSLSFVQGSGTTLLAPDGATMDGANSVAMLTLIADETWLLSGKVTTP